MSWFNKIFKGGGASSPEEVVRFYQELGFFMGYHAYQVVQLYADEHGEQPNPERVWDDVLLLKYSKGVWVDDPEADVCAANQVYSRVLPQWARISHNAFAPMDVTEHWESDKGPIAVSFQLRGHEEPVSVSPHFQDDWIDLAVLQQINELIAPSGRQFQCVVDGNLAMVMCLTPEERVAMQTKRQFPFAW
jgi:hypothetical protein